MDIADVDIETKTVEETCGLKYEHRRHPFEIAGMIQMCDGSATSKPIS